MQVSSALKYLNEIKPPIIHYDLKPGKIRWFLAFKELDFQQLICRKYSADRRLRERWHQNHGFRSIQNHGFWKLQSRPWHGFDVARSRNLLVLATRMLCGGQNTAKNLFKSWRLVARCHFLPMSLRQKGNFDFRRFDHIFSLKLNSFFSHSATISLRPLSLKKTLFWRPPKSNFLISLPYRQRPRISFASAWPTEKTIEWTSWKWSKMRTCVPHKQSNKKCRYGIHF